MFPSNMYFAEDQVTQEIHEVFLNAYTDLSNFTADQEETIRTAGYYTTLVKPGLRILAYNSNYG